MAQIIPFPAPITRLRQRYTPLNARAISAIHLDMQIAVTDDNIVLPITEMFDNNGAPCSQDVAVVVIAGTAVAGWYVVRVQDYERIKPS